MATVAEALRQHADDYLNQFGTRMPREHKRVLALIRKCRTGELGHLQYECSGCQRQHWVGRSCGNRHCPNCQADKTQAWLNNRLNELLPVPYFMVTFTVPQALRQVMRAHQRVCYRALFDCGSQTVRELASGKRFIGTDRLGFFGTLHTWGRDFTVYNPHVHFVVPGGGVSADGSKWQACPANFLLPEKAATTVFRAKFRDAVRAAGIEDEFLAVDAKAWTRGWNVDVKAVGDGRAVLKYLAPYVYRVAISNRRIENVSPTHVTYRYTPSGTITVKRRTVTGQEFVRGFLQHTLPPNFQRIRYYGFLSPNSRLKLDRIRMLVWFYLGWCYVLAKQNRIKPPEKRSPICDDCGGELILTSITDQHGRTVYYAPVRAPPGLPLERI